MTVKSTPPPHGRLESFARGLTLLTTFSTKLAGVVVGIHAAFQPVPDSRVLVLAALMLSGGQLSESLILSAIDRVKGREK